MALSEESQRRQALLDKISSRAEALLKESPDPRQEMEWAENRLFEANLFSGNPPKSPAPWVQQVIAENWDLQDESIPWVLEKDSRPEKAETFENLILSLIPSEGGL
jgi:hypothetical protein